MSIEGLEVAQVSAALREADGLDAVTVRALAGNKAEIRQFLPVDRSRQVESLALVDLGP
jgi:hypothetical protein